MSMLSLDDAVPCDGDVDPWVESGDEEDFCIGPQDVGPHVSWRLVSAAASFRCLVQRRLIFLNVVEGDWPWTGPWHNDGWVEEFCKYSYLGHRYSINPFDYNVLDRSRMGYEFPFDKERYLHGFPVMLDVGD